MRRCVVLAVVVGGFVLVSVLGSLFVFDPWDRVGPADTSSGEPVSSAEPSPESSSSEAHAGRSEPPGDLCEFVTADMLGPLVSDPGGVESDNSDVGFEENSRCRFEEVVERPAPKFSYLTSVEISLFRATENSIKPEDIARQVFQAECDFLKNQTSGSGAVKSKVDESSSVVDDLCGIVEFDRESGEIDIRIAVLDGVDMVRLRYNDSGIVPNANDAEIVELEQDVVSVADVLVEKLRG